jgi:hypothetical protein
MRSLASWKAIGFPAKLLAKSSSSRCSNKSFNLQSKGKTRSWSREQLARDNEFCFRKEALASASIPPAKIVTLRASATVASPPGLHAFWDEKTGDVISETRAVLAYDVRESALPIVAKRISAVASLAELASQIPLQLGFASKVTNYASGERFQLVIEGTYGRYLLIANLAGDGRVQFLFPKGNSNPLIMQDNLTIPMRASKPFGSDTLIVVAAKRRQKDLELDLSLLDTQQKPDEFLSAIREHITKNDLLGVINYSTHP